MQVSNSMAGKDYGKALEKSAQKILRESYGIPIAGQAISLAPRDTGKLKGSITYQTASGGGMVNAPATQADTVSKPQDKYTCHVGTNVKYAIMQEYGTARDITGTPFLRPAVDIVRTGARVDAALQIREEFKAENAKRYVAIG